MMYEYLETEYVLWICSDTGAISSEKAFASPYETLFVNIGDCVK